MTEPATSPDVPDRPSLASGILAGGVAVGLGAWLALTPAHLALLTTAGICVFLDRTRRFAWPNAVLVGLLVLGPPLWLRGQALGAPLPALPAWLTPAPASNLRDWQAQVTREREAAIAAKVQTMLDKVVGKGQSLVRVTAELDFPAQPGEGRPRVEVVVRRLMVTALIQGLPANRVDQMTRVIATAIGADEARRGDVILVQPVAFADPGIDKGVPLQQPGVEERPR